MTSFKQVCDDYEEKTGRPPKLPQINPELLSQKPTHFDKKKNVKVKIFLSTHFGPSVTAEIMEGENKGDWTQCFDTNLVKL
jgi:hypothetical protein